MDNRYIIVCKWTVDPMIRGIVIIIILAWNSYSVSAQSEKIWSMLEIYDVVNDQRELILTEDTIIESPNWSRDGKFIVYNKGGRLVKFDLETREQSVINTGFADKINNDHGISPDGTQLVISHNDVKSDSDLPDYMHSRIYTLPIEGGTPSPITDQVPSFWHGWSPDGQTLTYVGLRADNFDVYTISVKGGEEIRLTKTEGLDDGPDFFPDGKYIYYNSMQSGKMEIWRMHVDGGDKEQLTDDVYSNWFPHPSPDGKTIIFLSYLQDRGADHPPMEWVALRLYDLDENKVHLLCTFIGGQGTLNTPSWSPDGAKFAFVSYEFRE